MLKKKMISRLLPIVMSSICGISCNTRFSSACETKCEEKGEVGTHGRKLNEKELLSVTGHDGSNNKLEKKQREKMY